MKVLRALFLIPVYLYKALISPFFGNNNMCRYIPTCSTYMIDAVMKFGIFKGGVMGAARILRCNDRYLGGFDPVPDTWSKQSIKDGFTAFRK